LLDRLTPPPRSLISRVAAILSTFSAGSSHSVTEIAHLTGLPVSTAHRLTAELASWQLLNRTTDGRYEVGLALQRLHGDVSDTSALYERAPHMVSDLCEVTQRRARLGVLRGGRVVYIEKQVGSRPVTRFCPDAVLPAHATALGKALLAFSPRETVASVEQKLAAYTECTLTSPEQLRLALHFVRRTRRAVSRGELFPGDVAVAVPVFGPGGVVAAALELEVALADAAEVDAPAGLFGGRGGRGLGGEEGNGDGRDGGEAESSHGCLLLGTPREWGPR